MRTDLRATFQTLFLMTTLLAAACPIARAADDAGQPASALQNLNQLTDAEQAAGWKLLFDGKTTTGWRNFKKADVSQGWQVIDGALCRVDKSAGDIITNDEYDNFELELDSGPARTLGKMGWRGKGLCGRIFRVTSLLHAKGFLHADDRGSGCG